MTYWLTMEKDGKNIVFDTIVSGGAVGSDKDKKEKLVSILQSKSKTDDGIKSFIGNRTNIIIKNAAN